MSKSNVATATQNLPTKNVSAFEGLPTGLEKLTARDIIIPRLTILQQLSPQVTQGKPEYDKNAKVGDIYDVGLQERFEGSIIFIPVYYTKAYIEWAPRGSGKGLVAIHETADVLAKTNRNDRNQPVMPNGNYIAETAQLFGINVTADMRRSFLPMASTQLKKCKRILTLAASEKVQRGDGSSFTPPLYYRSYNLSTAPESNAMGNWIGWKIERGEALPDLFPSTFERILTEDIIPFRDSLSKGEVGGDLSGIDKEVGHDEDAF